MKLTNSTLTGNITSEFVKILPAAKTVILISFYYHDMQFLDHFCISDECVANDCIPDKL